MYIRNNLITELLKLKSYRKRLWEMEEYIKKYLYGFRDISTKCHTGYLLALSPDNELTTTPLLLYPVDCELKDFINDNCRCDRFSSLYGEWYKLDEKICGRYTCK
ncbi:hypothetical protein M9Y10_001749 [Tritrichomonas musculus]|uniref:Uncharacterized protein n=1 Tax=Tritrichomonas musculus TaxID=1915356 RepID=A0ABR2L8Q4_9EUKA